MAKGLRKPISRSTDTRADKKLERVFVDLSGKMAVPTIGGNRYTLIVRNDRTRLTRVCFLAKKSDAASAFESFLAEVRADGTPSTVMCVRSDNGGEFFGGEFGTLCRKRGIKQEFTPADSPKYNDVPERTLALISDTVLAARKILYPDAPSYPSLWAEAMSWACKALNRTAAKANPGNKSPYEIWYGSPPLAGEVWPFLKPAIYRVKREKSHSRKHKTATTSDPASTAPATCMRVLTTHRTIPTIRNVTRQHVPPAPPAPQQQSRSTIGGGGRGCHKFVPVLEGGGTKIAPPGDLFDQFLGEISSIRGKLADHVGDHAVLSPEGAILVTSTGTESSCPRPPPIVETLRTCHPLPERGSLQRGRVRMGRARQVKAEGGWQTWTASPNST